MTKQELKEKWIIRLKPQHREQCLKDLDSYIKELLLSDMEIAKEGCRQMGIDWEEEEDMVDAVRLKIWCDGAKWIKSQILKNLN